MSKKLNSPSSRVCRTDTTRPIIVNSTLKLLHWVALHCIALLCFALLLCVAHALHYFAGLKWN